MGVGVIHVFSQRKNVNATLNVFTDRRKWNKYACIGTSEQFNRRDEKPEKLQYEGISFQTLTRFIDLNLSDTFVLKMLDVRIC